MTLVSSQANYTSIPVGEALALVYLQSCQMILTCSSTEPPPLLPPHRSRPSSR